MEKRAREKILIVENDLHLRMLYELELQRQGYSTIACENADECLNCIEQEDPDLVVLDILLNGRDGLEILQAIRSSHGPLPVILNTAYACYRNNYLTYAADRCLIKSSDTSELIATITRLLREKASTWKARAYSAEEEVMDFSRKG